MNMTYLVRRPVHATHRPPLLILLHGLGSNEEDLFALASHFDERFLVLSLRAPFEMAPGYYRWFERTDTPGGRVIDTQEFDASRKMLIQEINNAVMAFGADPRQVFLMGFSQGAMMALALALSTPQKLFGVVAVAGRVLPEVANLAASQDALAHLRLLIQHGTEDTVVPVSDGYAARDLFADLHVMMGFHEYPAGHTLTPTMLADACDFLRAQLDPAQSAEDLH
ncbi:MAG: alpha/beta fold hydrolase [Rhodocyclaceae bacterium]